MFETSVVALCGDGSLLTVSEEGRVVAWPQTPAALNDSAPPTLSASFVGSKTPASCRTPSSIQVQQVHLHLKAIGEKEE